MPSRSYRGLLAVRPAAGQWEVGMQAWKLIVILIFCFVLRGIFTVLFKSEMDGYYLDLAGQTLFNMSLFGFCVYEFRLSKEKLRTVFGSPRPAFLLGGMGTGLILLMFTFGESAIRTMVLATWDLSFAYKLGNFHEEYYLAHPFTSIHVVSYLGTCVIMPALFEEFFFRGCLFPAFANKRSFLKSAIWCSAIFTLIHIGKSANLSAFVFSLFLCSMYARTGSLYLCAAAHATFNFFAFVSQYYFDLHRTRAISEISSPENWIPQLTMLGISLACFAIIVFRYGGFLKTWSQVPPLRFDFRPKDIFGRDPSVTHAD
jgi:membrane protease YdiL (CAAX protease family)